MNVTVVSNEPYQTTCISCYNSRTKYVRFRDVGSKGIQNHAPTHEAIDKWLAFALLAVHGDMFHFFCSLQNNINTPCPSKQPNEDSNTFIHQNYMTSTWIETLALVWAIVECYPCLFITVDMEILIKAWSRCHKDHHKWKRSDSPCNTGCITVFRTRFKHMWPRVVNKVGRVIYIAFSWALMRMKIRPVLLFYNQSMTSDDEKITYITFLKNLWSDKEDNNNKRNERTKTEMKITK